jgi:hypothetical protein
VQIWPSLNPTGHRAGTRHPSFERVDPNRLWPDALADDDGAGDLASHSHPSTDSGDRYAQLYVRAQEPGPVETCWAELFEVWRGAGFAAHVDLHTAMTRATTKYNNIL